MSYLFAHNESTADDNAKTIITVPNGDPFVSLIAVNAGTNDALLSWDGGAGFPARIRAGATLGLTNMDGLRINNTTLQIKNASAGQNITKFDCFILR